MKKLKYFFHPAFMFSALSAVKWMFLSKKRRDRLVYFQSPFLSY